jgi:NtrC-family two-component system sensor histidine kinase KinB
VTGARTGDSSSAIDLLAATAHELKTPLALIRALSEEIDTPELAAQFNDASLRALKLIDSIVLAQRVSNQQLELPLTPVDIASVIDETAYSLQTTAEANGQDLSVRISRRLPTVMGHKPSVQRMVYGLFDVVLRAGKPDQKIRIDARRHGETVNVSVTDTLDGLRPSEWQRAVDSPGKPLQPSPAFGDSSAISLYFIHHLSHAMHGSFSLQHNPKGQVFLLKLPQVMQMRLF